MNPIHPLAYRPQFKDRRIKDPLLKEYGFDPDLYLTVIRSETCFYER